MAIHVKTDSDLTSLAASSPSRSPRRPVYYVMSPANPDTDKMSTDGISPNGSPIRPPNHLRYASLSMLYHSRESLSTRFSASFKNGYWRRVSPEMQLHGGPGCEEEHEEKWGIRCYAFMFVIGFFLIFGLFSIILWGASKAHKPKVTVKNVIFESFHIQMGIDLNGVPTMMMSINSTVRMRFHNRASFFGVHVSSTPLELFYYDLTVASGHMKEFYSSRKDQREVVTAVAGRQVPLYGGGAGLSSHSGGGPETAVHFDLRFVVRSRGDVLGRLVRSMFYHRIRCSVYLHESKLGRPVDLRRSCQ